MSTIKYKNESDFDKAVRNEFGNLAHRYYTTDEVYGLEEKVLVEVCAPFAEGMTLGKIKKRLAGFGVKLSMRDIKSVLIVDAHHTKPNGVTFQSEPTFKLESANA